MCKRPSKISSLSKIWLYHFTTLWVLQSIELAIQAFRLVVRHKEMKQDAAEAGCKLVIAGGFDPRLAENREYLQELKTLVDDLGLSKQVA